MPNLTKIVSLVERIYKLPGYKEPIKRGKKAYTDLYICQMAVVQYLKGYTNESEYLRHLRRSKFRHFPKVPSQSQYNQRNKALAPLINQLSKRVLEKLAVAKTKIRIIDATGVPVTKLYRSYNTKAFRNKKYFGIGYCVAKKQHYYGQKLTLIVNQQGIPVAYHLMPANRHDIKAVQESVKDLSQVWLVGDKGYVSKRLKEQLRLKQRITIITPKRKNQKEQNSKWEKRKLKHRQLIEVINQQLKDHFQLEKLRAKSKEGIESRIRNILFAYLIAVYFNKINKRNLLSIKGILS